MQKDKIKLKLNIDQLRIMFTTINGAAQAEGKYKTMQEKLLLVNLISISKKMQTKWFFPSHINTITLTASEALAFWLVFNGDDYSNPYQMITMRSALDLIQKTYC